MNKINTFSFLRPDTLIKNLDSEPVVSTVDIASDAQSVWKVVGNFGGFPAFIPALDSCKMDGTGVRSVRRKLFKDKNVVIEQLNSRDDTALYMTWSLIYTTLPVGNLWASMTVAPDGEKQCSATWSIVAEPSAEWSGSLVEFRAFLQGFADDAMNNVLKLFT
ncbi:SRPBCC family protein [Pseudomonas sp. CCI3.2]|uniref:SRPBCC family protein n=1 Tax=unclassified Pseudomonas TaxID=196821 RepID=UPI002AC8C351|nr:MULTISPECIES: SRPBCC family protein [unclassified Pseudomonas]MEB0077732.1 SRPBCC family protein [Pseudomonas sp. MH10out]MEB0094280.1 SRPBCC family protein [Pseudomonas sp. CCI4.2]MEB0102845.1 SRPBCC family protein [Pseudomonas sp. CCI3.2]MEB0123689.1 SRPBCC family protein [Pseudomonas sp. CCI1.2]MEB0130738.1 SRPBCC family protein [Pseudomonas sp. CCI2.4]